MTDKKNYPRGNEEGLVREIGKGSQERMIKSEIENMQPETCSSTNFTKIQCTFHGSSSYFSGKFARALVFEERRKSEGLKGRKKRTRITISSLPPTRPNNNGVADKNPGERDSFAAPALNNYWRSYQRKIYLSLSDPLGSFFFPPFVIAARWCRFALPFPLPRRCSSFLPFPEFQRNLRRGRGTEPEGGY